VVPRLQRLYTMLTTDSEPVKAGPVVGMASTPVHVLAIDDYPSVRQMIADYLDDDDTLLVAFLAAPQRVLSLEQLVRPATHSQLLSPA
jgi:hypothetical protein